MELTMTAIPLVMGDYGAFTRVGSSICHGEHDVVTRTMAPTRPGDLAAGMIRVMIDELLAPAIHARSVDEFKSIYMRNARTLMLRVEALRLFLPPAPEAPDSVVAEVARTVGGPRWEEAMFDSLAHLQEADRICGLHATGIETPTDFQAKVILAHVGARMAWTWGAMCCLALHQSQEEIPRFILSEIFHLLRQAPRVVFITARRLELGEGSDVTDEDLYDEACILESTREMEREGTAPIPWDHVKASMAR